MLLHTGSGVIHPCLRVCLCADGVQEVRSLRDQVGLLGNSAEAHERMNARQKRAMAVSGACMDQQTLMCVSSFEDQPASRPGDCSLASRPSCQKVTDALQHLVIKPNLLLAGRMLSTHCVCPMCHAPMCRK